MKDREHWSVAVLDPHGGMAAVVRDALEPVECEVIRAPDWMDARELLGGRSIDLLIVSMCLPTGTDLERLRLGLGPGDGPPVAVMSGCTGTDLAARVLFPSAVAFVTVPTATGELREELVGVLRKANGSERTMLNGIVGASPEMRQVFRLVGEVLNADSTVLLTGETGTGKDLVARTIHELSDRASGPFIAIDCAGLSDTLLESELFGHARGAFTGAQRDRPGLFEAARGGTVFLDEVADASQRVQVRLLRVLQERQVRRLGESRNRPLDVRVIAATQRDLAEEVQGGRFREDLYYRLNVVAIGLPPLRERQGDIALLVDHWLRAHGWRGSVTPAALRALEGHSWPGNVRELWGVLEAAALHAASSPAIGLEHLPEAIRAAWMKRDALDRASLEVVLEETGGNRAAAARLLGVSRTTLWRRLKKAGL